MPATDRFREELLTTFRTFFAEAESKRRWNPYTDIPWDAVNREAPESLALCAETFMAVESFLPDYVSGAFSVIRESSLGQRWFTANWSYEELKHSIVLHEYLVRSGKRSEEALHDFHAQLMGRRWNVPFSTGRQMTLYAIFQEHATFLIYVRQEQVALAHGDRALAACYRFNARDECAHGRFYEAAARAYLEEDREGTLRDLALVAKGFRMPGVGIVPDYDRRIVTMREDAHIDRDLFLKKVFFPTLRRLNVTRQEIAAASAASRREAQDAGGTAATG
ncbi:MAG: acyl-ACP desaturase [Myxococcales bacterium]|nr:acyl-ACP desaturase [Myxococcales bacterium]